MTKIFKNKMLFVSLPDVYDGFKLLLIGFTVRYKYRLKAYQEPILLTIYTVCGTKFLREFVFADWRFFWFAGTNFCD